MTVTKASAFALAAALAWTSAAGADDDVFAGAAPVTAASLTAHQVGSYQFQSRDGCRSATHRASPGT